MVNAKSVTFVGASSQYISFGDVLGFERTDTFSIAFWAKWTSATAMDLIAKIETTSFKGYEIVTDTSGRVVLYLAVVTTTNQLGVRTDASWNDGKWHFFVVTYNGTSTPGGVVWYVDSAAVAMTTINNTLSSSIVHTGELEFGARANTGSRQFFTGSLDDTAFYNVVLTASQVQTLWSGGPADLSVVGPTANLIGWWRMGDGDTYPTLADSSSGGHNGTMTNMSAASISTDVWPAASQRRGRLSSLSPTGQAQTITPMSGVGESYGPVGSVLTDSSQKAQRRAGNSTLSPTGQGQTTVPMSGTGESYNIKASPLSRHDQLSYSPATVRVAFEGGGGSVSYYLMRGFRPLHVPPDFETWVAIGSPNTSNPSGEPIQDITIQSVWVV